MNEKLTILFLWFHIESPLFMSESTFHDDKIDLFNGETLKLPRPLDKIEQATIVYLSDIYQKDLPTPWESVGDHIYVPVDDGEIRIIHFKPQNPISKRPILLIPGWGVAPSTFIDFHEVMHNRCEWYYLESREKTSSRVRRLARFDMSQKAKDIGDTIKYLGLNELDFVLAGTCWGSAMILQGLMDKTIDAPTIICLDPMFKFTFPKWLTTIAPIIPIPLVHILKPLFKKKMVGGMKEERQLQRVNETIDDAMIWKWRRTAHQVRNFGLYGNLHKVQQEVFVANNNKDMIHDQVNYPNIAHQIPRGRYFQFNGGEDKREYVIAKLALEFSMVSKNTVPDSIHEFEVKIPRLSN